MATSRSDPALTKEQVDERFDELRREYGEDESQMARVRVIREGGEFNASA